MKHFKKVQDELTKNGIDWTLGSESGWEKNSIIFEGGDCKILLYVTEDKKGKMILSYHDLFEEGDYSPIFDEEVEETTTSFRGNTTSVKKMLKDIN